MSHSFAYAVVLVLGLGILAQWVAWRVRLPAIVLLALVGVIAGPVSGVLHPRQAFGDYLESIIGLCVAVILFEGGLNLAFHELKVAAAGVRRLVYLGVPLNWMGSAAAAHYVGGISWPVSWTFGAIVVVTGPTVIMPLLRQAVLNRRTASYLKWEGIINDPIGALLAVLVFQFLVFSGEGSPHGDVMLSLGKALLSAVALGGSAGYLAGQAFRRGFVPEYLKMPITLTLVLIVYVAGNLVQQEAGLLAVTIQGIVMGNMGLPSIQEMRRFKEYITIMLVSAVFILLTANLDPGTLQNLEWRALPLIVVLMVLVRPLAVWLATIGAGMDLRDRLLVGWVGPRGIVAAAVAGVFAPRLVAGGYPDGQVLVPVVFTLIMATVLLHGVSLSWLARRLGLAARARNRILIVGSSPWTTGLARLLQDLDQKVLIVDTSWHRLRHARLAGLSVYYGEILSDVAVESLELNDVGILLAATSNDAYNALVCTAFANELGRNSVFQLPMFAADEDDPRGMTRTVRGRIAFGEKALYEELWQWLTQGWTFQKTRITEGYSFEQFTQERGDEIITLLTVGEDGQVTFNSVQQPVQPREGDTVVYFGPPRRATDRSAEPTPPDGETQKPLTENT